AAGPLREPARRGAAVRAGRPLRPGRRPRDRRPGRVRPAGAGPRRVDAATASARGGLAVTVDAEGWPAGERTNADPLLYRTAAELLNNVVKHAEAAAATVTLELTGETARLVVADDGVGMPENAAAGALRRGHIGLASHTLRIDAAGGRFTSAAGTPHGTVVTVELPVRRSEDPGVVPSIDRQADGVDGR